MTLDELLEQAWLHELGRSPELAVQRGLPVEGLPDFSEEASAEQAGFASRVLDRLDEMPDSLHGRVLRHMMNERVAAHHHYWDDLVVTPYQLALRVRGPMSAVFSAAEFTRPQDADLVSDYAGLVRSLRDKTLGQAERGIRVPRPALPGVRRTLASMRDHAQRLLIRPGTAGSIRDAVERLVRTEVMPAYDGLLAALGSDYAEAAPEEVGYGEEYYRHCVRRETTLAAEPEDLHRLGLAECRELAEQMAETRAKLGFTGTESEFHERLRHDRRLFARDPAEVEARYHRYLQRIGPRLQEYFGDPPSTPYAVRRLDPALEPTMTFGYYSGPTPADPVGVYHYNGSDLENRSMLGAAALIYRELVPGAHLQTTAQLENAALPPLLRDGARFLAFTEAWAEYAAALAAEMGLYDDPYDHYGWLTAQRFTAQRLVVDTGLNLLGWSLEQGRAFMRANTVESEAQITSEILRYSTDLPGQALGYRAGYLALAGYRASAQAALGARFDIRGFHRLVLGSGPLPLDLLGEEVDRWVY
ncbi:DUF885 domain-containing protein [Nonomuraea sp. NPDC050536]|uniref:DUF885 domain-containing protein n=1 Tax=Nonomuraea sp. NPDC050536 TaxID=3364366 RepID=UPI0037C701A7